MEEHRDTFQFTYSAVQQQEVEQIRQKYLPPEEDKLAQLRRLDRSTTRQGKIVSLTAGILGTLLFGLGMSCVLVWQGDWFIPGVSIGLLGIALGALAYPLYQHITRRARQKIAPEILRLTEELLQ